MINPINPLSLYTFSLELFLYVGLFSFRFDRRRFFVPRLLLSLSLIVGYTLLWDLGNGILAVDIPCYTLLFLLAIGLIYFCFDIPFLSSVFLATAGYTCQHFTYKAIQIFLLWIEIGIPSLRDNGILANVIYILFYLVFIPFFYFFFARKIKARDEELMNNRRTILIAVAILLGATTMNLFFENAIEPFDQVSLFLVCSFYDLLCSILALFFLFQLFFQGKMLREYKERRNLWAQEKKQLEINKENFDYLMILAHDLKHIVEDIDASSQSERVKELNSRLLAFGSALKTGNESLDLVLAERKQNMDRNKIAITVMADGSCLSFLSPTDCYALFMNLIDNAIEALLQVEDSNARSLSLSIRKEMGLVFIHEENPYQGTIAFQNGRPLSKKTDGFPHGIGVSSMQRVCSSYGGEITFHAKNGVFSVDIVLDPEKSRDKDSIA